MGEAGVVEFGGDLAAQLVADGCLGLPGGEDLLEGFSLLVVGECGGDVGADLPFAAGGLPDLVDQLVGEAHRDPFHNFIIPSYRVRRVLLRTGPDRWSGATASHWTRLIASRATMPPAVGRYRPGMPGLSAALLSELTYALDCAVTLRRTGDDRLTQAGVVVNTGWDVDQFSENDRKLLARQVSGEPDEDGWLTARVAALSGYLLDLADPDLLDQADEISAGLLAAAVRLRDDGDRVFVVEDADWFPPFDPPPLARATLELLRRVLGGWLTGSPT